MLLLQSDKPQLKTDKGVISAQEALTLENCGHSERLLILAQWAQEYFLLHHDFEQAAFHHDVGKLFLPRLDRLGRKLEEDERIILQSHVMLSWQYAVQMGFGEGVTQTILLHHERWDGKGYVLGRKKEEIPLSARVLSVLDAYDAMRVGRAYQGALSPEEARREIRQGAGTQFDPQVAEMFLEYLEVEWPDC